jgi:RimJ/RimL family protein N-acetyltransferase
MNANLLTGELVHLVAADPQQTAEAYSRWSRDSEFWRLMASDISQPYSKKQTAASFEKWQGKEDPDNFYFSIRTLNGDQMIGDIGLDGVQWNHGDTFVGIGIGERDFWGKGYGTDAMRIILRYAFTELNLWRVSLDVFEYNPRAVRSYEKAGFVHEGRIRQALNRAGKRWDIIFMGITREEWQRNTP